MLFTFAADVDNNTADAIAEKVEDLLFGRYDINTRVFLEED